MCWIHFHCQYEECLKTNIGNYRPIIIVPGNPNYLINLSFLTHVVKNKQHLFSQFFRKKTSCVSINN